MTTKKPTPPAPAPTVEVEEDPTVNAVAEGTKPKPPFYVCEGKAITTRRGILADGDEIKAEDLNEDEKEGKQRLADLIKSAYVAKGGK